MRQATLFTAALAALALAGAALADQWQVQRTAAGNAAARAAVVSRADLGTATGWTGGPKTPDLDSTPPCGTFHPKQSDLVVVGAAASAWQHAGLQLQSQANVLRTPAMVSTDWARSIDDPKATPCLRTTLLKELGPGATLVHFGAIAFPHVTSLTRCYRAVVTIAGVKVLVDVLVIGKGRTEIELTTVAPLASRFADPNRRAAPRPAARRSRAGIESSVR